MGAWERGELGRRLHFHALTYIPKGEMPGGKQVDYSPQHARSDHNAGTLVRCVKRRSLSRKAERQRRDIRIRCRAFYTAQIVAGK